MPSYRCLDHPELGAMSNLKLRGHFSMKHGFSGTVDALLTEHADKIEEVNTSVPLPGSEETPTAKGSRMDATLQANMSRMLQMDIEEMETQREKIREREATLQEKEDNERAYLEEKAEKVESIEAMVTKVGLAAMKREIEGGKQPPPPTPGTQTQQPKTIESEIFEGIKEDIINMAKKRIKGEDQKEPNWKFDNETMGQFTKMADKGMETYEKHDKRRADIEREKALWERRSKFMLERRLTLQEGINFVNQFQERFGKVDPKQALKLMELYAGDVAKEGEKATEPPEIEPEQEKTEEEKEDSVDVDKLAAKVKKELAAEEKKKEPESSESESKEEPKQEATPDATTAGDKKSKNRGHKRS
ncbi:hypothetical protein MUP59_09440 [Candidatus Bathyarchaeota archaeon]|nr:hypothetical protein [Candidatus Bathyarchaeota archaeon]